MVKLTLASNWIFALTGISLSLVAITARSLPAETLSRATSEAEHSFQVSLDWYSCQQIGKQYQEVSSFETANFYINICSKGDRYFYSGQAKQDYLGSIFLPAYPLANKQSYIAHNGNISYLIAIAASENRLVIRKNGRQIASEKAVNLSCRQVAHPAALQTRPQTSPRC